MAGTLVLDTLRNGAGTASTSADNVINGCAKAWCLYNGATATIIQSFNISSVTVNGTGDFTFNYTTALTKADNCVVAMGSGDGGPASPNLYGGAGTNLTTSVRVYSWGTSTHFANCIAVFSS